MESPVHVPASETASFRTDEKHVHFLNTMEASFVRTMLDNKNNHRRHHHRFLRLDRHLPDTSESTLDMKHCRTGKHHAPSSDSVGQTTKRTKRRSSQPCDSSQDQVVPQVENEERKGAACYGDNDKGAEN
ncbi:uncharacterized protein LOC130738299 [Lotus japonicus]|uniref:uncharacterized protein LOC130738299 n=1 Tax=Lotus japonicus TaxID=34305 RepID=UPI00258A856B|nr:uncharacterized protein LOC130738299 [Lotus japonicus]